MRKRQRKKNEKRYGSVWVNMQRMFVMARSSKHVFYSPALNTNVFEIKNSASDGTGED